MSKIKKIEMVAAPPEPHFVGDGFRVHNFIPSFRNITMRRMDPIIMLDYNSLYKFPPSQNKKGVGVHPHRGFETVTIAYKGSISHHDSAGGGGTISEGDVQWMTAGAGILHKEYHEENFSKKGGEFQMVQLWVNLPRKHKMTNPKYQSIKNKDLKTISLGNDGSKLEIIAGNHKGHRGPVDTFSPITLLNLFLEKEREESFSFPQNYNTALLVLEGKVLINEEEKVDTNHFVLFENSGEEFTVKGLSKSKVLILSGEPLNEPIAAHGPFVMSTYEELQQAFLDFNNGDFGELDD